MLAFCRGDSQGEWDQEVKEEGGVILVHSEGPFQEGFEGEWGGVGVGMREGTRIPFSVLLIPHPTVPGCRELAKAFPYIASEESHLGWFFFFFPNVCFLVRAHPPEFGSWGRAKSGLYSNCCLSLSPCLMPT